MSDSKAIQLKEEGNRYFIKGNYVSAEGCYSKAIIADPKNHLLYTNRAMSRLKLQLWDAVIADCQDALALNPDSMKASYYLSQALLPIGDLDGAVQSGLRAHAACVKANDRSLVAITNQVLACKKARWEHKEKLRKRHNQDLEQEMVDLLEKERDQALSVASGEVEKSELATEWEEKIRGIRDVFEQGRAKDEQRREVPDWVIDDISFGIMVDPVITKTGKSYERASIMEYLRQHPNDPLTREPLQPSELRPNIALKSACEEFLEENGWAVDW